MLLVVAMLLVLLRSAVTKVSISCAVVLLCWLCHSSGCPSRRMAYLLLVVVLWGPCCPGCARLLVIHVLVRIARGVIIKTIHALIQVPLQAQQ
jgi:hypothetical protein